MDIFMQFRVVAKALLAFVGAAALPGTIFSQQPVRSEAECVSSPDGNYEACWVDLIRTTGSQGRRLILVTDLTSNKLIFTHATFQRFSGAVWNSSSNKCAIFDAPDNANVYLSLLTKQDTKGQNWAVREIDVSKLAKARMPDAFAKKPVRMGIEKLSWDEGEILDLQLILNGQTMDIRIPAHE
jgi:hypothetical protein